MIEQMTEQMLPVFRTNIENRLMAVFAVNLFIERGEKFAVLFVLQFLADKVYRRN